MPHLTVIAKTSGYLQKFIILSESPHEEISSKE